jgi:hypothetical protein
MDAGTPLVFSSWQVFYQGMPIQHLKDRSSMVFS